MGFLFTNTIIEVYTLGNKIEDSLIAAGWAGFSEADMDQLARRTELSDEQKRDVYLNKTAAEELCLEYIRKNLKLDSGNRPTGESYIPCKNEPVEILEITVLNPDDLPGICSKGASIGRTTIHIVVRIPVDVAFLGRRHLEKHVDVDVKAFYKN